MMIALTRGYHTEIDFSDWWKVQGHSWYVSIRPNSAYAIASKNGTTVSMHRLIKPPPEGMQIDHKDGNGLHNRWDNLRVATSKQNNANAFRVENSTGFIGVNLSSNGRWGARAVIDGKRQHIGTFDTAEEAAHAYDKWTLKEYGEFAQLNFPRKIT